MSRPAGHANLALLLDTQILVWIGSDDARLPARIREQLLDPDTTLFISAVTAWEFVDLEERSRLPQGVSFPAIADRLDATVLDFPAEAWRIVQAMPKPHLDPIDRMLIAHAMLADLTLVTADAQMRAYPVKTLW
jgi:PIN domain nuclease of toxin-antitoxin system